jgi:isopentenyl-diphosphate delta-isomerase
LSKVILVNGEDEPLGVMDKMEAHKKACCTGLSAFLFSTGKGRCYCSNGLWINTTAVGLWTNACCSHPLPGEETFAAAQRRLREEMGFDTTL